MTNEQLRNMIATIRTYDFMFKESGIVNYKESRDKLMREIKRRTNLNNVYTLKVA